MLGLFGKMIGFGIKDYGNLLIPMILQYMTIGEMQEIAGTDNILKYKTFLIPDKLIGGKKKTRKIIFSGDMESEMTDEQALQESFKILEEEGGLDGKMEIFRVNPEIFRKIKFATKIMPDTVLPPSDNVRKALNLEEYDRAITSPFANQVELYKDLLLGSYDGTRGDIDKYVKEPEEQAQQGQSGGVNSSLVGAIAGVSGGKGATRPIDQLLKGK